MKNSNVKGQNLLTPMKSKKDKAIRKTTKQKHKNQFKANW